ncbi:MAG TPA: hypothetical protein VFX86_02880 [Candidatus Saccharimonadales bacterium]|nr:hypothetical protein [Candidatus Saccharimonadales bacterium]
MGDLLTAQHNIFIEDRVQREVLGPEVEDFLAGHEGSYGPTFSGTSEAVLAEEREANGSAYFVPGVRFLVKSGLAMLNHEEVNYQIPREVEDRTLVAYDTLRYTAALKGISDVLHAGYEGADVPRPQGAKRARHNPGNLEQMGGLSTAVFGDARMLAGGALKLLRDNEPPVANATEVIQRSYGLLKLAHVVEVVLPALHEQLGAPYAYTGNLRLSGNSDGMTVRFTPNIFKRLKGYTPYRKGGGCPVAKMRSVNMAGTILQEDWQSVVEYLILPDATINNHAEYRLQAQSA